MFTEDPWFPATDAWNLVELDSLKYVHASNFRNQIRWLNKITFLAQSTPRLLISQYRRMKPKPPTLLQEYLTLELWNPSK